MSDPREMKIEHFSANCTLVAVREVTGRTDREIIDAFLDAGWKPNQGFYTHKYMNIIRARFGHEIESVETRIPGRSWSSSTYYDSYGNICYRSSPTYRMTLAMFVEAFPAGTYMVAVTGHALVVRDGRVIDPNFRKVGMARRVVSAYLIKNPAPSHYARHEIVPLARGEDPLVRFVGVSQRSRGQDSRLRENEALTHFLRENGTSWLQDGLKPVRLSTLIEKTRYLRRDAAWDILRGRLVRVPE